MKYLLKTKETSQELEVLVHLDDVWGRSTSLHGLDLALVGIRDRDDACDGSLE